MLACRSSVATIGTAGRPGSAAAAAPPSTSGSLSATIAPCRASSRASTGRAGARRCPSRRTRSQASRPVAGPPARRAAGPGRRSRVVPASPQRLDEAAQLVGLGQLLEQLRPPQNAERLEVGARGRQRVEGVGFLPQLADGDAHSLPPQVSPKRQRGTRTLTRIRWLTPLPSWNRWPGRAGSALLHVGERHGGAETVMAGRPAVVVEVDAMLDGRADEAQHLLR